MLAGWYSGIGNALTGLWLVAFCPALRYGDALPHSLIVFGIVTGGFMAIGLPGVPGVFAGVDSMASLPWYLYVAFFGWLGTYVLYPIWTMRPAGNLLLR